MAFLKLLDKEFNFPINDEVEKVQDKLDLLITTMKLMGYKFKSGVFATGNIYGDLRYGKEVKNIIFKFRFFDNGSLDYFDIWMKEDLINRWYTSQSVDILIEMLDDVFNKM